MTNSVIVNNTNQVVQVKSSVQRIIVDYAEQTANVVLSGPVGPRGYPGDGVMPVPDDPADDGLGLVAEGGEFVLVPIVRSELPLWIIPITQEAWDALPIPRDPSKVYLIGDF